MKIFLLLGLLFLVSCNNMNMDNNTKENIPVNVFFEEVFNTPHQTIPFDRIKLDDYLPAMREGFKRQDVEIAAIVDNEEEPTFENTIVALERSGQFLSRVQSAFYNLLSAETCDEMDEIANTISPEETEHSNSISLNEKLFARVKSVYDRRDSIVLSVEQQMLLQDTYDFFVNHGADLCDADKEEYKEISRKLSLLELQFSQNVLSATNKYKLVITDKAMLKGLPNSILEEAKERAKQKDTEGWCFDLTRPSYSPFMKYVENRDLRKELYMAYNTRALEGELDNRPVVKEMVNLRLRLAQLLGFRNYADYKLKDRMAENKENVYKLLNELLDAYKPTAKKEIEEVQKYAYAAGADFTIMPWDWSYYSEKLKEEKFNLNDELLRPYFELEKVKKGVFGLATRLYGLTFRRNEDIPVYHPEVEAYEVFDKDGEFLAVFYADFHPRKGKQGGAWMTEYLCQHIDEQGVNVRPHISIVTNFPRATDSTPALLTFDDVQTFLHEFGHSIHGMVSNVTYSSLSGTNVYRDFVELPSQLMENWAYEKDYLDSFAVHYQNGTTIPFEMIESIRNSANFNTGYAALRQLSFGYLDMGWHVIERPFDGDVLSFERDAWEKAQTLPTVDGTSMSVQFTHIFSGGYSAGYYSYKWAEVLDADAFSVFQKEGIFNTETASRFRREVLEKGGSEHPMKLYKRFRRGEPSIVPLLRRNGIIQ